MLSNVGLLFIITIQQFQHFTQSFQTNTNNLHSFKMQFLAIVSIALAGLASAASIPEKRNSTPEGCTSAYYNDGSDGSTGGWGCTGSDSWGNCQGYYWKESPPFWSVSKMLSQQFRVGEILTASFSDSASSKGTLGFSKSIKATLQ